MNYQEKYKRAKEVGYSDEEIIEYLTTQDPSFQSKVAQAQDAGYTPEEIAGYFQGSEPNTATAVEEAPQAVQQKRKNPAAIPKVTPEEYQNLPFWEKMGYTEALEKEHAYDVYKDVAKGYASGATFGATENIPVLRPEEEDNPYAVGAGKFLGAAAPIGLISKGVEAFFKVPTVIAQYGTPSLRFANRFFKGAATGGTYEAGKQTVNAASGKEVDLKQILTTAGEFGTLGAVGGALLERFGKLSPKHQAQILEQRVIPHDLPKSEYETAEKMLQMVQAQARPPSAPATPNAPTGPRPTPPSTTAPGLEGRVTPQAEENIGLRPPPQRAQPRLEDQVGNIFSPQRVYNTTEAGRGQKNVIMEVDQDVHRGVGDAYNISREVNRQVEVQHPNLVQQVQHGIAQIERIPAPSTIQESLLRSARRVLNRLAEFENVEDEEGNPVLDERGNPVREIVRYLPVNNQDLIDQVQSLRQIIDYDFAHGDAKNIFRPLINQVQDAALHAAEISGHPEAAEALNYARQLYRQWVTAFDNPYVRPYRDASNQDFSKLYKSSLDLDEHNMLRGILNMSPQGQALVNASTADLVEKHLSKFFKNPREIDSREFNKALRELEAVITPEQAQQIRDRFAEATRRPPFKATAPRRPEAPPEAPLTSAEQVAAKYLGKKPEVIQKMMNERSGIKELREDFSGSEQKRELFETLSQQKMRSLLRGGKIEADFKGTQLYDFLNDAHNYEIFSELLGQKETEAMRLAAKDIGKQQVKLEARKAALKTAAQHALGYKTLKIVLGVF